MNISKYFRWIAAISAAVPLVISVFGLLNMHDEFDDLSQSQRAGPLWHATQLQSEVLRFEQSLLRFATGHEESTSEEVRFRFDILWSRVPVAERKLELVDLDRKPDADILRELLAVLMEHQNRIATLADGDTATAMLVFDSVNALEGEIQRFAVSVKDVQARLDASTREGFVRLSEKTVILALIVAFASLSSAALFFTDSQRHRRFSNQNKQLAQSAKEAYAAKSDFISTVNHELRTPLTSIRGALAIIEKTVGSHAPESLVKVVAIAHRNCRRLETLINDVLDFEKLDVGLSYDLQAIDLRTSVSDAVTANRSYNEQSNCKLILELPEEPVMAMADDGRVIQLMSNLISNAIKFSNFGGDVIVSLTMTETAEIRVQDFGVGIPAEFRDKVFERFSQADPTVTRQHGGSGLGMCITKSIVQAHGGEISLESEVGVGTTFIVKLPLLKEPQEPFFEKVA